MEIKLTGEVMESLNSTSTSTFNICNEKHTIDDFTFKKTTEGNFIEVIKRVKSQIWPQVDSVFKEVYGIKVSEDGSTSLSLLKTIPGIITPGHYVEEVITFKEEE